LNRKNSGREVAKSQSDFISIFGVKEKKLDFFRNLVGFFVFGIDDLYTSEFSHQAVFFNRGEIFAKDVGAIQGKFRKLRFTINRIGALVFYPSRNIYFVRFVGVARIGVSGEKQQARTKYTKLFQGLAAKGVIPWQNVYTNGA
jgi:hypothetical protein